MKSSLYVNDNENSLEHICFSVYCKLSQETMYRRAVVLPVICQRSL